jgi:hypothetical protein
MNVIVTAVVQLWRAPDLNFIIGDWIRGQRLRRLGRADRVRGNDSNQSIPAPDRELLL